MRKALVVGINDYPNSPLTGCINDASAFASIMETHGDGSPNFAVKLETDVPTKAELKKLIVDLFRGNNDIALLYFSGHGFLTAIGGYVVTPDNHEFDLGVSMDEILTIANNSEAKDKIVILDCCNSGAFGSPKISGGSTSQLVEGSTILTASTAKEVAMEINGHGVFTNLLLDAIQGGAADLRGHITPGSVYSYIDQALGPWEQRPVFKTNVTRFTSLRTINPQVPITILRKIIEYFPEPQYQYPLNPSFEDTNSENSPNGITPYAKSENVEIFKNLQKLQSIGLVVPVDAEFMYFAAMNSTSCRLTALGAHYWRLAKDRKI